MAHLEPRFLCDAMLAGLGRRLRMAGYDTRIAGGKHSDHELLRAAKDEGRIFLTADRQVLEHRAAKEEGRVLYLAGNEEAAWAAALSRGCGVRWLHRPFSRCLECNSELEPLAASRAEGLPAGVKRETAKWCPACGKAYWDGTHVRRMRARLEELDKLPESGASARLHKNSC